MGRVVLRQRLQPGLGQHNVKSEAGVQQGDPLGPLVFSLAIQPLVQELASIGKNGRPGDASDLVVFYLDDGVVCGSPQAVSQALARLQERAGALGLSLNLGKCELVCTRDAPPAGLDRLFPRDWKSR